MFLSGCNVKDHFIKVSCKWISEEVSFILFITVLISLHFHLKPKQKYIMCCFVDEFTPTSVEWVYFCLYSNEFFVRKVTLSLVLSVRVFPTMHTLAELL